MTDRVVTAVERAAEALRAAQPSGADRIREQAARARVALEDAQNMKGARR